MADDEQTTGEPQGPTGRAGWLRWGSVFVDIEPPPGPNPWTKPGWAGLAPSEAPFSPPAEPPRSRRNVLLFALGAAVAALIGFLLVAAFSRDDRPPVLAVTTSTSRPRPATTTTRPVATTRPAATTTPIRPSTTAGGGPSSAPTTTPGPGTTATRPGGGGPITIPEGVPPSSAVVPPTVSPSTAAPPTTTTIAGPLAFLGVSVEESFEEGVRVVDVLPGTGAQAAGLLPGDVITDIDATAVRSLDELGAAIVAHRPGDSITVTVLRNGTTVTVRATLGTRPAQ